MISVFQNSENSGYEYQVAPDMAMTVRMIMILLYGAGGVPGRAKTMEAASCSEMAGKDPRYEPHIR